MRLLLDAHTLVLVLSEPELPFGVRASVADKKNEVFVSLATLWELANKVAAGRLLVLGTSVESIVAAIDDLGATFLEITQSDIIAAATLPRHHADPFDRMIVAQAQARSMVLVTKDSDIGGYDVQLLW